MPTDSFEQKPFEVFGNSRFDSKICESIVLPSFEFKIWITSGDSQTDSLHSTWTGLVTNIPRVNSLRVLLWKDLEMGASKGSDTNETLLSLRCLRHFLALTPKKRFRGCFWDHSTNVAHFYRNRNACASVSLKFVSTVTPIMQWNLM